MDAAEMHFLDASFETVTAFYMLMYINEEKTHNKVFTEVYRVLTPGGRFLIWDAIIPDRAGKHEDVAVFQLSINLGNEEIHAGYGMPWPLTARGADYYMELAKNTGFDIIFCKEEGHRLFLAVRKGKLKGAA
jgi:ubiquinone/menaquinone biosynthesis C-methylase UbiE